MSQLAEADLAAPNPGESFSCFGRAPEGVVFSYDGAEHRNDLRSCHYTPLKGVVAYQENRDDWWMLARAYTAALSALTAVPSQEGASVKRAVDQDPPSGRGQEDG